MKNSDLKIWCKPNRVIPLFFSGMLAEYEFLNINSLNVSFKILWSAAGGIHVFLTANILINFCFAPLTLDYRKRYRGSLQPFSMGKKP